MSALPVGLLAGGSALSGLSGLFGAQSSNRAARQQRDFADRRQGQSMDRILGLLFGQGAVRGRYNEGNQDGQKWYDKSADLSGANAASQLGYGSGLAQGFQNSTKQLNKRFGQIGRQYDQGAAQLNAQAGGLEGLASLFGSGAEHLIDQETARGLEGANRTSSAALAARGFGASSLVGNQMSSNAADFARQAAGQKVGVRQATLDRRMDARKYGTNLGATLLNQGTDMKSKFAGTMADQRRANLNTLLQAFQGMQGSTQYNPAGQSGAGNIAGSLGNASAGLGSLFLMQDMFGRGGQQSGSTFPWGS